MEGSVPGESRPGTMSSDGRCTASGKMAAKRREDVDTLGAGEENTFQE